METFPNAQLTTNRLYAWVLMHYGVRITKIIKEIEEIEQMEVKSEQIDKMYEIIAFGLALSEIIFMILEFYTKNNQTNRMVIPEFYRFAWVSLEVI